jgi:hypothetical protein
VCFFIGDHCLPSFEAGNGTCATTFKVEFGLLGEIVSTFLEVMEGLKLLVGSIILSSSMTHLLVDGLDAYTAAVVEQAGRLVRAFKGGVVGVPGTPVMLAGADYPEAVRGLHDYCQWLPALEISEHGGDGFMRAAARL